jgi:O-methyltransferase
MFISIPPVADAYIMKRVICDWPDEACVKILKSCRSAVNPGGKCWWSTV